MKAKAKVKTKVKTKEPGHCNKIVDHVCPRKNCDYSISDFEDEKLICPKCKTKLKVSTLMNHSVANVRNFWHVEKRKS